MGFDYKGRSAESIKKEAAAAAGSYDDYMKPGTQKFKPHDGDNTIRVLPGNSTWDEKEWGDSWGLTLWLHGNIGVDRSSYLCANKMLGKPCAICDARQDVLDDKEEADVLRPAKRTGVYLIDRHAEKDGPLFWSMPQSQIALEILQRSTDRKSGAAVLIDHPVDGYDVMFRKTGTGRNTDYTAVEIDRDASYLCDNQKREQEWLDYIQDHSLPTLLVFHPYEYLEKVVKGQTSRREQNDDKEGRDGARSRGRDKEPASTETEDRRTSRSRDGDRKEEPEKSRSRGRDRDEPERGKDREEPARGRDRDRGDPDKDKGVEREDRRPRRGRDDAGPSSDAAPAERSERRTRDADSAERGRTDDRESSRDRVRSRDVEEPRADEGRSRSRDRGADDEKDTRRGSRSDDKAGDPDDESARAREDLGRMRDKRR